MTPTLENSDHAGCDSNTGPSWVASLVNAIGESPYWDSTAIFIFWDDYGGWYDPEPPAFVDYDGLGLRLPMLIVSPYAKKGHVSHVHFEHGSILKFVEDTFGLPRMAASDARATRPQKDASISRSLPARSSRSRAPYGIDYFKHQPIDYRTPGCGIASLTLPLAMAALLGRRAAAGRAAISPRPARCAASARVRARRARSSRSVERQDQARRHHRPREPQLQQPLLRLSGREDGALRLRLSEPIRSRSRRSRSRRSGTSSHNSCAILRRHATARAASRARIAG